MSSDDSVVVLAGGTGGAKLARGLLDHLGERLTVIANTGDDIEIYGSYVSPDPDLVMFWLADLIDKRGWGLHQDSFGVMDGLRVIGEDIWFNLGDRDLAICLKRAELLASGATLTEATSYLATTLKLKASVLPASDAPIRTKVKADGRWWDLQELLIRRRSDGPIEDLRFDGALSATPTEQALAAISGASTIVIGPSNPFISIGPMLAVPGISEALKTASAPVVAVSPIVAGGVLKGPTADFLAWAGLPVNAKGIADHYRGLLDGLVTDEQLEIPDLPVLSTSTELSTPSQRNAVADQVLKFSAALSNQKRPQDSGRAV